MSFKTIRDQVGMPAQTSLTDQHGWHVEPYSNGMWRVADDQGRHLRQRFFTPESAQEYAAQASAAQLGGPR